MVQNITPEQMSCIGEIARRIYHQTFPLLTRDLTYFDDKSLVLHILFLKRVSFQRKETTLVRYQRMMTKYLRRYYDQVTIKDQIRSQRESKS